MLYALYILIVTVLVCIDQFSKYLIVKNFNLYEVLVIIKDFFNLTYVQNYGAGFSILQNATVFLSAISLIAIIALSYLLVTSKKEEKLNKIAYLLVIGGALGNLIDRIRFSYVVDFLDFYIFGYDFPTFNAADCFITIGCFLVIVSILMESKNAKN